MKKDNKKERERTYVPQWDNEKNTDKKLRKENMGERVSGVENWKVLVSNYVIQIIKKTDDQPVNHSGR